MVKLTMMARGMNGTRLKKPQSQECLTLMKEAYTVSSAPSTLLLLKSIANKHL